MTSESNFLRPLRRTRDWKRRTDGSSGYSVRRRRAYPNSGRELWGGGVKPRLQGMGGEGCRAFCCAAPFSARCQEHNCDGNFRSWPLSWTAFHRWVNFGTRLVKGQGESAFCPVYWAVQRIRRMSPNKTSQFWHSAQPAQYLVGAIIHAFHSEHLIFWGFFNCF